MGEPVSVFYDIVATGHCLVRCTMKQTNRKSPSALQVPFTSSCCRIIPGCPETFGKACHYTSRLSGQTIRVGLAPFPMQSGLLIPGIGHFQLIVSSQNSGSLPKAQPSSEPDMFPQVFLLIFLEVTKKKKKKPEQPLPLILKKKKKAPRGRKKTRF